MSGTLLEAMNPNGNIQAHVESDGDVVYFYLFHIWQQDEADRVRACWVRNLQTAPSELDAESLRTGNPPLMPAAACAHPDGLTVPAAEDLRVVWFEEGNGAALLERDQLLAIIPPWSGCEGFHGYARDCTAESPLAWPMPETDTLIRRIDRAEQYWRLWDRDEFWSDYRDCMLQAMETHFQRRHEKYYAIDGGNWPPKALLRFDLPDRNVLVTMGAALRPQPNVEMYVEAPSLFRRIELAVAVDPACTDDELHKLGSYLSGQSGYPWSHYTWLGHGHTMPCSATPESLGGAAFPNVLLCTSLHGIPPLDLPDFQDDPINVLWMLPITPEECRFAEQQGSGPLIDRLSPVVDNMTFRKRDAVV
jgi:hypothetical protein